jgi:hypothetical protein
VNSSPHFDEITALRSANFMKVKVKLSLCLTEHHARNTLGGGGGGIAPLILDLGIRRR